jgi:hypothetical protein
MTADPAWGLVRRSGRIRGIRQRKNHRQYGMERKNTAALAAADIEHSLGRRLRGLVFSGGASVTTTGHTPAATAAGTTKLIWVTPTRPFGIPTNGRLVTAMPPTVIETAATGLGKTATAVLAVGVLPSARVGPTAPSTRMEKNALR